VSPDIRRFLPLILIAMFAILVLPSLLKGHKSTTSASSRATDTIGALNLVDKGEQAYMAAHSRYTDHVADLLTPKLADDLARGLAIELGTSTDGQTYYARVASDVLSLLRSRAGAKKTADSCVVLKSGNGVKCPVVGTPAAKAK
jgi:hypothetical protein